MSDDKRAAFTAAMTTLAGDDLAGAMASAVADASDAEAAGGAGLYWAISEICDNADRIVFFDWKVSGDDFVWQLRRLALAHDVPPLGPKAADAAAARIDKATPDCLDEMSAIGTALFGAEGKVFVWVETDADAHAMGALAPEEAARLAGSRFCDGSSITRP
ncbi:hypothetical protein RDV64_00275 [Acuticoccus sp. MNP-M23]|uniref:DUF6630 family protein n=1 Tax=Acuticoccus sp. MNP-M23 TaxID=3072793 RepID=UPI0028158B79|nr:hypothetical protein [Acuticoccus sp. MNP-M23]WMS42873.1 hypothetical protein RDV64_00275 [Acuticoccus sp. MNP-M23]